jgi:hypothetical protein
MCKPALFPISLLTFILLSNNLPALPYSLNNYTPDSGNFEAEGVILLIEQTITLYHERAISEIVIFKDNIEDSVTLSNEFIK